jgi:hypothetical protein
MKSSMKSKQDFHYRRSSLLSQLLQEIQEEDNEQEFVSKPANKKYIKIH